MPTAKKLFIARIHTHTDKHPYSISSKWVYVQVAVLRAVSVCLCISIYVLVQHGAIPVYRPSIPSCAHSSSCRPLRSESNKMLYPNLNLCPLSRILRSIRHYVGHIHTLCISVSLSSRSDLQMGGAVAPLM